MIGDHDSTDHPMKGQATFDTVPIGSVEPHPDNPRQGEVSKIKASLAHFGQYRPIVVQKGTRHILAGNHTWKAAVELDWAEIDVVVVDVDDDEAKAIMLADNRLADLGTYDDTALLALIEALPESLPPELVGFSDAALADLRDIVKELEDRGGAPTEDRGELLELLNVTIADPEVIPESGSVYRLGDQHILVCADVMTEWEAWRVWLLEGMTFIPYPGPLAVLGVKAENRKMVMVQPDPYIAGHILQHWKDAGNEYALLEE